MSNPLLARLKAAGLTGGGGGSVDAMRATPSPSVQMGGFDRRWDAALTYAAPHTSRSNVTPSPASRGGGQSFSTWGDPFRGAQPTTTSGAGADGAHMGPGAVPPSYDVVHLSARNARLEEKLNKALDKHRSTAKYYDQLLAKTREAHAREREADASSARALRDEVALLHGVGDALVKERAEREALLHGERAQPPRTTRRLPRVHIITSHHPSFRSVWCRLTCWCLTCSPTVQRSSRVHKNWRRFDRRKR